MSSSLGVVFVNLLSFVLTSADSLLVGVFCLLCFLFYPNLVCLLESPLWLVRQKKYGQATEVLKQIGIMNNRKIPDVLLQHFLEALQGSQVVHKLDEMQGKLSLLGKAKLIFANPTYTKQLLILCSISSALYTLFYGMLTSVQDLGLKTFQFNGILVGITQAMGFVVVLRFVTVHKRKAGLLFIQSTLLFGGYLLVCMSFWEQSAVTRLIEGGISTLWISTVISSLFSFLYVTNAESFPTQVRGLAVGIILLCGKLVGSLAPYVNLFSKLMKVHVLAGSSILMFLSIILTMFLRETLQKDSKAH